MINRLPSEIIAHIGTFIKNTDDRKNTYLASKNFSHLLYHNIRHIVSFRANKDILYFDRLARVLRKRKPNLRTIVFTFDFLHKDEAVDVSSKVECFVRAFPRANLEGYISRCERPDDIVQALPDDTLITHFIHSFSTAVIDIDKLAHKRFKIFNISAVANLASLLSSKNLLDRVETLIISNRNGKSIDLSQVDTTLTTSVILEVSSINFSDTPHIDLYKVTELRLVMVQFSGSFKDIAKAIESEPMFKKRSRMKQVSFHLRDCEAIDILIALFKYFPKYTRMLTIVSTPQDLYTLDKISNHGIEVVLWAKSIYHHQCAQAINFIIGHVRTYQIVYDLNFSPYHYKTPQELYNDCISEEERKNWCVLKYLYNR